jgi:hypothetical protein
MSPVPGILSEIIKCKGLSMNQCMWRLTASDDAGRPSTCIFSNPVELSACDGTKEGLWCKASSLRPQQRTRSTPIT